MSTPFLGEVKLIAWNFPPKGWAFCNGQLLAISQNQALFSILGTTYGGDGRTSFALPNLQSRVAIHTGNGYTLGQLGGEPAHTVLINELPTHTHTLMGSSDTAGYQSPVNALFADTRGSDAIEQYRPEPDAALSPAAVSSTGGAQPHNNMQPYLVLNFVIALQGIFPSQAVPAGSGQ